jgi:ureidoacrylate peracid hydrolase
MGALTTIDPRRTALLTIDLQNDFLHPEGAYGRAGQGSDAIKALPARVAPVRDALRAKGGTYVSAQFTLVPGPGGEPLIAPHLKQLRPFLTKGDFAPGGFGHSLVDRLAPADYTVEKVAYSAFYQTRLEYILRALDIDTLIVGGIVTNGGVASTLRDAHLRNIETVMLSDGCASFKSEVHEATLISLGTVTHVMSCADTIALLEAAT